MEIENSLKHVENWGRYQKRLSILLILSSIPAGWLMVFMVFTTATPPHRCRLSPTEEGTETIISTTTSFVSVTNYTPADQCSMIDTSNTTGNNSMVNCIYGWHYDLQNGKTTVVTEWDLICDKAWIRPLTTTAWVVGGIVSSLTLGWLSDRYGRKKIYLIGMFTQLIFCFIAALSINVFMYGAALFFIGYFSSAHLSVGVVIVSEMLGPRERTIVGNLLMTGFAVGYMILPLFAYIAPSWRWILVLCGAPVVFYVPYLCLIPESFRWLVQNGQYKRARQLAQEIINYNNIVVTDSTADGSDSEIQKLHLEKREKGSQPKQAMGFLDMVRDPVIRKRTFICLFSWFILNAGYYFFSLNTSNLGGNEYINCFISGFLEIPASMISMMLMKFVGRRKSYAVLMLISALAIGITPFAILWNNAIGIVIGMAGKLLQTAAFDLMILYTPELFPTLMRSKILFSCMLVGRAGSIMAPYIVFLGERVSMILPYLIVAAVTGLSSLLVFLLPETRGIEVPDTIEEAKKITTRRNKQLRIQKQPTNSV